MDVEGENAKYLLPPYARGPGPPVELQWLAWTAAHQKLLTAFAGASLPDVAMISNDWLAEFMRVGVASPLPPAVVPALFDDQIPVAQAPLRRGGRAFAAPWSVDTLVQHYRRDRLAEVGESAPPSRWTAWLGMLRAIKRRRPDGFPILMQLNWPEHLFALFAQAGAPLLRDRDGFGDFRSPAAVAALGLYRSLFEEGLAPAVTSVEVDDPVAELASGRIALYWGGSWTRAELRRRAAELPAARWASAPLPGPDGPGRAAVAGRSLVLSHDARRPAQAMALIGYLGRPDVQARFFELAGVLPTRASAWRLPALTADVSAQAFADQLSRPYATPVVLEWPRIVTAVQQVAERLARGELGVEAAATEMDRTTDAILAKRRWLLDRGLA